MTNARITAGRERVDARQALADALERIERGDGRVGAFVDVLESRAGVEAADRDAVAPDPSARLHGVPIAIKELFDVEGADGSYGSDVLEGRRAPTDAAVVTSLRDAGAVVVGTTRSHEFGWGITTQHATRGSTRNPWNLDRVPGGSSGGSAAAVAAGFVPLAVGTDTGGSIRIPAAFCGVLGLKTTWGRISRAGSVALAPSFDSVGFLAREAALLAAAFEVCATADPGDPPSVISPPARRAELGTDVSRLRFANPAALTPHTLDAPRASAMAAVEQAFRELGMQPAEVALPDAQAMLDAFVPIQLAEALDVHTNQLATFPRLAERYGDDVRGRLEMAASVSLAQYLAAQRQRDAVTAAFARAFELADVLVSPVGAAGPSLTATPDVVTLGGSEVPLRAAMMVYTVPQNLAGLPSITCPVGFDDDGLPIGVQLTGARWSEPLLLELMAALERTGAVTVATADLGA